MLVMCSTKKNEYSRGGRDSSRLLAAQKEKSTLPM